MVEAEDVYIFCPANSTLREDVSQDFYGMLCGLYDGLFREPAWP
jgi:hypothetical protein